MSVVSSASSSNAHIGLPVDPSHLAADAFLTKPWADDRRRHLHGVVNLSVAVIDDRPLISDCFGRGVTAIDASLEIQYYSDLSSFDHAERQDAERVNLVLVCATWSKRKSDLYFSEISRLHHARPDIDIIILSDIEDITDIIKAVECGVRGYIPSTVSLEVAVRAMHLIAAGGVYIPASVLFGYSRAALQNAAPAEEEKVGQIFTSRQMLVIEALRKGKANKIIAYDLNMCESTVKDHVRNIMKRLKAKNRTEVAYILNNMEHKGLEMT